MTVLLKEITQISIYLKEERERINEIALSQPLVHTSPFAIDKNLLAARVWRYTTEVPPKQRLSLKFWQLLFKFIPSLIPPERQTPEAKFKTILAILLAQKPVRDFFLGDAARRKNFYQALKEAAHLSGYLDFSPKQIEKENDPDVISGILTRLTGRKSSLVEDVVELNLQMASLKDEERSEILFLILNRLRRPPISSIVEIKSSDSTVLIPLTTKFAKYKIDHYDKKTGKITYTFTENQATSSIRTLKNSIPDAKGAINQRIVQDSVTKTWIGSYCGELSTPFHVLEQILLILDLKSEEATIISQLPETVQVEEKNIFFTSLYSWHEIALITDQQAAIQTWDKKILKSETTFYRLNLHYFNIPFNAFNKYPSPAEMQAAIQDINDQTLISLTLKALRHLGIQSQELENIATRIESRTKNSRGLDKLTILSEEIDDFRKLKKSLISQIEDLSTAAPFASALKNLLTEREKDGKSLKGMDKLLYLDYIVTELSYFHNKNCHNSTDRSAAADAADKAQYAFKKMVQKPFLPGLSSEEEADLFKVLYSLYLVWEEPEINTALSTGFMGEKFYNNFIQKNPETTRYLTAWLKKHPAIYLGLSDYRT